MMATVTKFLNFWEKVLCYIALVSFLGLIAVVTLQICSRLFLPWVFAWTEELSRFLFITTVCTISPVAFRHHEFVFVDFVLNRLKNRSILEFLNKILLLIFLSLITVSAVSFLKLGYINTSPVLKIPMWIAYAMPFLSFLFLMIFSIETLLSSVIYQEKKKV